MKTKLTRSFTIGSLLLTFALTSCADPYGYGFGPSYGNVGYGGGGYGGGYGRAPAQGAVTGGLLGAAAGGIIGNQSRRGLEGAAIGGLIGVLAGSALQNSRQQGYYGRPAYNYNTGFNSGCQQPFYQPNYCQPMGFNQNFGYGQSYGFGGWQ